MTAANWRHRAPAELDGLNQLIAPAAEAGHLFVAERGSIACSWPSGSRGREEKQQQQQQSWCLIIMTLEHWRPPAGAPFVALLLGPKNNNNNNTTAGDKPWAEQEEEAAAAATDRVRGHWSVRRPPVRLLRALVKRAAPPE